MPPSIAIAWGTTLAEAAPRVSVALAGTTSRSEWTGHDRPSSAPGPTGPLMGLILADLAEGSAVSSSDRADTRVWQGARIASAGEPAPASRFMLINMMNIPAAYEEEFNAWYDTEHIVRLCEVDGVDSAFRFRAADTSAPRYVTCYHISDSALVSSPAWEKAARTPWTARIGPHTTDRARMLFTRV